MKILFIENRYRTIFWNTIAEKLQQEQDEVFFLVQNHRFKPNNGHITIIPYPAKDNRGELSSEDLELIKSDRNINYFGHTEIAHYTYYRKFIHSYLNQIQPDVVFGESTAFHELITIDLCKKMGIPYLQPTTCRFPIGRFSFYQYDTLDPFSGSDEVLTEKDAMHIVDSIAERSIKPDYMQKQRISLAVRMKRGLNLLNLSLSYWSGEHYNTPNPWVKYKLEKRRRELINHWDILAKERKSRMAASGIKILYPLQMQPEANLDVWGRPFRNQLRTIQQLIAHTPPDVAIIVKPNPKSKYELTEDMLSYIASENRVIPVEHTMSMSQVLPLSSMVVTVTGTIAIECIQSNIPVVTLVRTLNNTTENCLWVESFDKITSCIDLVRLGRFPAITDKAKVDFISLLNRTSFKGLPYEIMTSEENIADCIGAFRKILQHLLIYKYSFDQKVSYGPLS